MLRRREVSRSVDTAPKPEQPPLLDESSNRDPRRAPGLEIPRTHEYPGARVAQAASMSSDG